VSRHFILFTLCISCFIVKGQYNIGINKGKFLENLMLTQPTNFKSIIANKDSLRVQIIYTKIDRHNNKRPTFTNFAFNVNDNTYFYPASTVKLPVSLLALEKLNNLKIKGLNKNTTMLTDSAYNGETAVTAHPLAQDGKPTIENYLKQILLVSDNDAFNRLYEFLGQEYIQQKLTEKGYKAAIRHRLQLSLSTEQNAVTNPIRFYDNKGNLVYKQVAKYSNATFSKSPILIGKGYYKNDTLINKPFNFGDKNKLTLKELHSILQSVMFPESLPKKQRFNLSSDDYSFMKHWMSAYPNESDYPHYDTVNYWPAYCKPLLFGCQKGEVPTNIKIFNKAGDAYGFLTDVAYITDTTNKIEFILAATIYCNSDGIFNDDKYDYDTVGYPFMKNLGKLLYDYELNRKK